MFVVGNAIAAYKRAAQSYQVAAKNHHHSAVQLKNNNLRAQPDNIDKVTPSFAAVLQDVMSVDKVRQIDKPVAQLINADATKPAVDLIGITTTLNEAEGYLRLAVELRDKMTTSLNKILDMNI